jgi:hypothetical protein
MQSRGGIAEPAGRVAGGSTPLLRGQRPSRSHQLPIASSTYRMIRGQIDAKLPPDALSPHLGERLVRAGRWPQVRRLKRDSGELLDGSGGYEVIEQSKHVGQEAFEQHNGICMQITMRWDRA